MKIKGVVRLVVIVACFYCTAAGCGYNFAGRGPLPANVDTVCIAVFENNSTMLGLENDFTNSLIQEFTRRRAGSVVGRDVADAVLSGEIASVTTSTVSHRDKYSATERRARVTLNVRLVSNDGRTLWTGDKISDNEVYPVEGEKFATDQNLRAAVEKLAGDLAERIYNQMTANF